MVPIHRVMAIYARENGQGMAFPVSDDDSGASPTLTAVNVHEADDGEGEAPTPPTPSSPRPALKRVK
jgi:stringent starvation protein B